MGWLVRRGSAGEGWRRRLGVVVITAAMALAGCGGPSAAPPDDRTPSSSTPAQQPDLSSTPAQQPGSSSQTGSDPAAKPFTVLASDVQRRQGGTSPAAARETMAGFGIDLFRQVAGDGANVVVSPYSLYSVLAMVRAGAEGETARQLDDALHADGTDAQGAALVTIDQALASAAGDQVVIDQADQVWLQDGFEVQPAYLDALAKQYGAEAVAADFAKAPDAVRAAINAWVADRTRGLITDLFGPDTISSDTRLALVNAVYLKAAWRLPFRVIEGSRAFTTGDGHTVATPMMSGLDLFQGASGDEWVSVTMPYLRDGLAMTLLLPDVGRYDDVLDRLDPELLAEASGFGDATVRNVTLIMPPFATRSRPDVLGAMKALGVTDLFDSGTADLSGMTGDRQLSVSALVQQAVISVDQNGTEAAAASGAAVEDSGIMAEPLKLTVDRPFLYWIADTVTGAPLFIGTVTDPTA